MEPMIETTVNLCCARCGFTRLCHPGANGQKGHPGACDQFTEFMSFAEIYSSGKAVLHGRIIE